MPIHSINPATEELIETFPEATADEIDSILEAAQAAYRVWSRTPIEARAERVGALAAVLRADKARWAALITEEMGKPIVEAEAEVEKCAWNCEYFAANGPRFLADEPVPTEARESYVAFDPLGVVLAIMPWNFPFWQVFRFLAPTLVAGNTAVLKHAANVPRCALAIEEIVRRAGLPDGTLRALLVGNEAVDAIIGDPRIAAVTLTGSSAAGEKVAAAAGRRLKKQVLELGGSDPFIVLADADLDAAAQTAARARNQNAGQSCIAAKRFIVEEPVADAFLERFTAAVQALRVGDPADRTTNVGPLARADLRDTLARQVEASRAHGARLVLGGAPLARRGFFYQPTILDRVQPDMPAFREETFGPVAAVIRARESEEAIALANASEYGLGAALWTADLDRAKALARRIEAGLVFINGLVASDPRLPFGGIKRSGYGRELGVFGIREFTNIKTVWVGPSTPR
ncbi:MAG: NAD-dependent succinate-semialdehyde dehydrogenase [Chloroflexota bacterium]|nr:NAD-dependent succinate-semialdehyde dehydrogenase [Dehalococcoidia bacterium]MDW8252837.1 NAD-dependent succinate-semialdehyde dehydrogenase [Chloroflexota bacterium]